MKKFHTMFFYQNHGLKKTLLIANLSLILSVAFGLLNIVTVSAQSLQNKTYTINCKNQTVESIFEQVEKLSRYNFLYQSSDIKNLKKVTYDFVKATLSDIVTYCLKESGLTFEIINNQVVISPSSQEKKARVPITVTGKVANSTGELLVGANIIIKGTLKGTITDEEGNYKIEVPDNTVLVFSFLGYSNKEVFVRGKTLINIILDEESVDLAEAVLISTGYQKIRPEQSTGSLSVIKAREFDTRVNTTDFLTGLQNKIPGLLINDDIDFEGNSLFQIRGISTINGNRSPLIVMDGYPTELSLDMINPNEIESVTVLKDAAAATVYGARSSNGVIIIERKKAQIGKPVTNFRVTLSFTPKENYERYRWDKDVSSILTEWEKINSASLNNRAWERLSTLQGASYNYNPAVMIMAHWRAISGAISTEERDRQLAELASYNNTQDYSRLFLRTASTRTYNLDISGGNEFARYYITGSYIKSDLSQIMRDNNHIKLSGRTTVNFTKKFSLELTIDFQNSNKNSVPVPGINSLYPYERLMDDDGNPLSVHIGSYANPFYNQAMMTAGTFDNRYYPLKEIHEIQDMTRSVNNRITSNFRYEIGKGFNLNFGGVYELSGTDTKHLASENSAEVRQYINRYSQDGTDGLLYNIPKGAFLRQRTGNMESFTLRAQLNYDKKINEDHSLNLILGGEVRDVIEKSGSAAYFGYNDQTLFHLPVDYKSLETFSATYGRSNPSVSYRNLFSQGFVENRFISAYSNLVYSFKNKYSLTGSIRIDQSNLFGTDPKYKYKPLWSVGAAWNISREDFMQNIEWLRSLKLRSAFGFNGNVAKNALPQVIASDGLNYLYPLETTPMLTLLSYANSGLRWEQTRNLNIGVDYRISRNISGNIDYYIKKSMDLLATNQIDASKGGTSALINQASILNKGIETALQADWISRKNFNWNTGFVFSYNTSKVLQVYNTNINPNTSISRTYITGSYSNYLEGYAVGAMFTFRYAGLDETGAPLIYDKENNPKRFFTNDQGRDELLYSGSSIPVYNAGLSNRVDIGSFYIYCMLNFYGGFNVRVPVPLLNPNIARPLEGAGNYWKAAGDEANPDLLPYPNILTTSSSTYLAYTDKYTVNGAYLTVGDLTASYSLRKSKLLKNTGISNFEIRLQASNLYTIGFNKYNLSMATKSYEKSYLTPTYTMGLYVSF